jgi:hypothetical protein
MNYFLKQNEVILSSSLRWSPRIVNVFIENWSKLVIYIYPMLFLLCVLNHLNPHEET